MTGKHRFAIDYLNVKSMKRRYCRKKFVSVTASGAIRTFKLGFFGPKCKRFIPEKSKIKESLQLEGEL